MSVFEQSRSDSYKSWVSTHGYLHDLALRGRTGLALAPKKCGAPVSFERDYAPSTSEGLKVRGARASESGSMSRTVRNVRERDAPNILVVNKKQCNPSLDFKFHL